MDNDKSLSAFAGNRKIFCLVFALIVFASSVSAVMIPKVEGMLKKIARLSLFIFIFRLWGETEGFLRNMDFGENYLFVSRR